MCGGWEGRLVSSKAITSHYHETSHRTSTSVLETHKSPLSLNHCSSTAMFCTALALPYLNMGRSLPPAALSTLTESKPRPLIPVTNSGND